MGFFKKFKKAFKNVVNDTVAKSSFGVVDLANNKVSFNPETAGENFMNGSTFSGTINDTLGMNKAPKLPEVEDPAEQEDKARAAANAKIGNEKRGLASTLLGGSLGDDSNIKKKKLLGE